MSLCRFAFYPVSGCWMVQHVAEWWMIQNVYFTGFGIDTVWIRDTEWRLIQIGSMDTDSRVVQFVSFIQCVSYLRMQIL